MDWFLKSLDPRNWLVAAAPTLSFQSAGFLGLAALILLGGGIVFWFLARKKKKTDRPLARGLRRLGWCFFSAGLYLGFWDFWAYERIYILGAPWWLVLGLIGWLIWLGWIIYFLIVKLPKLQIEERERRQFEKYLPKPAR